jgi:hypothetical protein
VWSAHLDRLKELIPVGRGSGIREGFGGDISPSSRRL